MKYLLLCIAIGILFSSCTPIAQSYQVFKTTSPQLSADNHYDNSDVKVGYNLWTNGGKLEVDVTNKTDSPLYIDWAQSSLVRNGFAYSVYQQQELQTSAVLSQSNTLSYLMNPTYLQSPSKSASISKSVSVKTSNIVFVPPHSTINQTFFEGAIASRIDSCNFVLQAKEQTKSYNYNDSNTPYMYRFYMGYSKESNLAKMNFIDNTFWVSGVTLMNETEFQGKKIDKQNCEGEIITHFEYPFRNAQAFYFNQESVTSSNGKGGGAVAVAVIVCVGLLVGIVAAAGN